MRLGAARAAIAFLVAAACSEFGRADPVAATPDAGADAAATTSGAADAGSADAAAADARATSSCDPTIPNAIACLDFDSAASHNPPFGFDDLTTTGAARIALEASAVDAGQAFGLTFAGTASDDHSSFGSFEIADFDRYSTLVLDADVTIEEFDLEYAVLAGFVVLGETCSVAQGLARNASELEFRSGGANKPLGDDARGLPFHFHLEASIHPGKTGTTAIAVMRPDGTMQTANSTTTYSSTCSNVQLWVGAWYTSQNSDEALHVQYDRIVISSK